MCIDLYYHVAWADQRPVLHMVVTQLCSYYLHAWSVHAEAIEVTEVGKATLTPAGYSCMP